MKNKNDWQSETNRLLSEAGRYDRENHTDQSIKTYELAYQSIPDPKQESELAMIALCSIGELYFLQGSQDSAFKNFAEAVKCKGGLGNPHIHMRLGQLQYDRGNLERAADEFMRVYMEAGNDFFVSENPKYFDLIRPYVE